MPLQPHGERVSAAAGSTSKNTTRHLRINEVKEVAGIQGSVDPGRSNQLLETHFCIIIDSKKCVTHFTESKFMKTQQIRYYAKRIRIYKKVAFCYGGLLAILIVGIITGTLHYRLAGILLILLISFIPFSLYIENFFRKSPIVQVIGNSMAPTLENGDYVHIVRITDQNRGELKEGDIVVFARPSIFGKTQDFKRIRSIDAIENRIDMRGDNEGISRDSRHFGKMKISKVTHKVDEIYAAIDLSPKVLDARKTQSDYNIEIPRGNNDESSSISIRTSEAILLHNKGLELFEAGEIDKAMTYFDRATALHPIDESSSISIRTSKAMLFHNKGVELFEEGEIDKAITYFDRAIELNPKEKMHYQERGYLHLTNGDHNSAIKDYSTCIKLSPANNPDVMLNYYFLAMANYENSNSEEAEIMLNRIIDQKMLYEDPESLLNLSNAHLLRAKARIVLNKHQDALSDLNNSILLDNKNADAYFYRGCLYQDNDLNKAIEDYKTALELDPEFYNAKAGFAYLLLEQGKSEEGETMAWEVIRDYPFLTDIDMEDKLASYYHDKGELDKGIDLISKVIDFAEKQDSNKTLVDILLYRRIRGLFYCYDNQHSKALDEARVVRDISIKIRGRASYSDIYVALSFFLVGYLKSAEEYLEGYEAIFDEKYRIPGFYTLNGQIARMRGDSLKALDYFNQCIKLHNNHHDAIAYRGFVYLDQGDFVDALSDLTQAFEFSTTDQEKAELAVAKAKAKKGMGDITAAVEDCAKALHLDPTNDDAREFLELIKSEMNPPESSKEGDSAG